MLKAGKENVIIHIRMVLKGSTQNECMRSAGIILPPGDDIRNAYTNKLGEIIGYEKEELQWRNKI